MFFEVTIDRVQILSYHAVSLGYGTIVSAVPIV